MKYLLIILLLLNTYVSLRNTMWEQMVAANYLESLWKQHKCTSDMIFENRLPIIERTLRFPGYDSDPGILDTTTCDAAEASWANYEEQRLKFLHHDWIPTMKYLFHYHYWIEDSKK